MKQAEYEYKINISVAYRFICQFRDNNERDAGKQGMLSGGWVSRPPARRIAPPSPLKLPQEAVVGSEKMGGGRDAGWAKVKLPLLIPAAFPGSYPPPHRTLAKVRTERSLFLGQPGPCRITAASI